MDPAPPPATGSTNAAASAQREPGTGVALARLAPLTVPRAVAAPLDVALGAASLVVVPAVRMTGAVVSWAGPPLAALLRAAAHPPLAPENLSPGALLAGLERRGHQVRRAAVYDAVTVVGRGADVAVPVVTDLVLDRVDLTTLVLSRVGLLPIVEAVLDGLDLTGIVVDRVELDRVVEAALEGLDLTGIVVDRVELDRVVEAALGDLDLTGIVVEQVDLARVVTTALDRLDLTELVRARVDLAALSNEVIEAVDLPEIIRQSSTGVASDVVQGARMSAMGADEQVSRVVDRFLLRRRGRRLDAPGAVEEDQHTRSSTESAVDPQGPGGSS